MIKFIGDFSLLEKLGFHLNKYKTYYIYSSNKKSKFYNPLVINIEDRKVEFSDEKDLKIIED